MLRAQPPSLRAGAAPYPAPAYFPNGFARAASAASPMPLRPLGLVLLLAVLPLAALPLARPAAAQFATPSQRFLQVGPAVLPGFGVQATFSTPLFTVLTREGALYAEYAPRFLDNDDGRILVGLGVGASVRVFRVLTVVTDYDAGPYDLDVGFRFGPSFFFSLFEQDARSKARSFRLFGDPFVRGSVRFNSGRVVFAELGAQAPRLRGGLLFGL